MSRISEPLLDRIDIELEVPAVHYRDLRGPPEGEPSAVTRERDMVKAFDLVEAEEIGEGVHEKYHQLVHELAEH